jgi:hypothetical protein
VVQKPLRTENTGNFFMAAFDVKTSATVISCPLVVRIAKIIASPPN